MGWLRGFVVTAVLLEFSDHPVGGRCWVIAAPTLDRPGFCFQ